MIYETELAGEGLEENSSQGSTPDVGAQRGSTGDDKLKKELIKANYGNLRERLLRATPAKHHCRLFCGGRRCKYCNPSGNQWKPSQKALKGIFSHWVTEDMLAMARPTSEGIAKHKLIDQMKTAELRSIINLTRIEEHSSCGPPLDSSGFSYNAEEFMKHEVFHYNFGWPDFGVVNVSVLLDMVKVLNFALSQGKVAIHCHAGLGRTGVLICCFLIWKQRISPSDAVKVVRNKRPGSVQTTEQVAIVHHFAEYMKPLRMVFFPGISFESYVKTQREALHGYEARVLKNIPKVVFVIGERLLELCGYKNDGCLLAKLTKLFTTGDETFYEKLQKTVQNSVGFARTLLLPNLPPISAASQRYRKRSSTTEPPSVSNSTNHRQANSSNSQSQVLAVPLPPISVSQKSATSSSLSPNEIFGSNNRSFRNSFRPQTSSSSDTEDVLSQSVNSATSRRSVASHRFVADARRMSPIENRCDSDVESVQRAQHKQFQTLLDSLRMRKLKHAAKVKQFRKAVNKSSDPWKDLAHIQDSEFLLHFLDSWFDCFSDVIVTFKQSNGHYAGAEVQMKACQKETLFYVCNFMLCLSGSNEKLLAQSAEVISRWFTKRPYDRLANRYVLSCFEILRNSSHHAPKFS